MSEPAVNPLAPGLTGRLSERAAALVSERLASGRLSPYACRDASAIRRDPCERDRDTALRPAFVRDAEKVVHLPAYNRLAGKTQVFSFRANDDLARRGLHVQLVARVARDIGRALGLNLDLIEAIALAHDLGHTPFGHAGERFLNDVYHERTGRWFFHNVQSVRVMDELAGRNVSLQTGRSATTASSSSSASRRAGWPSSTPSSAWSPRAGNVGTRRSRTCAR